MKKVVLSLAVLFSVAMVACNNKTNETAVDSDSVNVEMTEEVVADSNETAAVVAEEVAEAPKAEAEVKEEAPKADAAAPAEEPAKEENKEAAK